MYIHNLSYLLSEHEFAKLCQWIVLKRSIVNIKRVDLD